MQYSGKQRNLQKNLGLETTTLALEQTGMEFTLQPTKLLLNLMLGQKEQ
jgi:hypothetical protein